MGSVNARVGESREASGSGRGGRRYGAGNVTRGERRDRRARASMGEEGPQREAPFGDRKAENLGEVLMA